MSGISSSAAKGIGYSTNKKKYNGYEENKDFDLNLYESFYRTHDPQIGRFWQIDPKPTEDISLYGTMNNNPILFTDFLGDTTRYFNISTGALLGVINNVGALTNVKVNAEIYNLTVSDYEGQDINSQSIANQIAGGINLTGVVSELMGEKNQIAFQTDLSLSFTGEANPRNPAEANGRLNVNAIFDDGTSLTVDSYQAVGGPYGNGAPENGSYTADNLRNRGTTAGGNYHPGMTRDGVGFSLNLNPTFPTDRSLLRIHADGRTPGTQGCIGIQCDANQLNQFVSTMRNYLRNNESINVNINIRNNPNNNGRGGRRVQNNGE